MRILIASSHRNVIGGVESYLQAVIPFLLKRGHELGLVYGYESDPGRDTIDSAVDRLPRWCLETLGIPALLDGVNQWAPDVVYSQGIESADLESVLLDRYRSVMFAHGYYGTCATGRKCHFSPRPIPCSRRFGPMCLVLHYPRRCGGLNPLTEWRNYRLESERHRMLERFASVLVASRHMYQEMQNNGVDPSRLRLVPLPSTSITPVAQPPVPRPPEGRILLMGRLTGLKGGAHLMHAIPRAAEKLNIPLSLTVAGTGSEEPKLKKLAARLGIAAEFTGWVSGRQREQVISGCDLIAFPSLWPEPFGLSGIEAACLGVPAVGYAVGGIPDWLIPGVSGELAPGNPPAASGLADAIARAFSSTAHYCRLSQGAWEVSRRFSLDSHVEKLEEVLNAVAHSQPLAVNR